MFWIGAKPNLLYNKTFFHQCECTIFNYINKNVFLFFRIILHNYCFSFRTSKCDEASTFSTTRKIVTFKGVYSNIMSNIWSIITSKQNWSNGFQFFFNISVFLVIYVDISDKFRHDLDFHHGINLQLSTILWHAVHICSYKICAANKQLSIPKIETRWSIWFPNSKGKITF